jgi:hypothetical protein
MSSKGQETLGVVQVFYTRNRVFLAIRIGVDWKCYEPITTI